VQRIDRHRLGGQFAENVLVDIEKSIAAQSLPEAEKILKASRFN
jgi:hypothetical protein